ncbi:hypothetical protein EU538_05300 [Candidatus Thorarchaeota archaeon]|nr:MAG: hypothetical protein EU538_05300 [Candidatus Thorarchaeota archaeon]
MSLTARDLLHRIAEDTGQSFTELARRVNDEMASGKGIMDAVRKILIKNGLDPNEYRLSPVRIVNRITHLLEEEYSQTLMISAVLAQMVESTDKDRFPPPAFFIFLELLNSVPEAKQTTNLSLSSEIDEKTTEIIELTTTLVSIICSWSKQGITGVARDCPDELRDLARVVARKTRLYQAGLWTCLSCGKVVDLKDTRALLCSECDAKIYGDLEDMPVRTYHERERTGFGKTKKGPELE